MGYTIRIVKKADFGAMPAPVVEETKPTEDVKAPEKTLDEMAKKRVTLAEKMLEMKKQLDKIREQFDANGLADLGQEVKGEEPELIEALKKIDGMQHTIDGWVVKLKTKKGYDLPKEREIIDYLTKYAEKADKKLLKIINALKSSSKYKTHVDDMEGVDVSPFKEKPTLKKKKSSMTRDAEGYIEKFKSWIKRTFLPEWNELTSIFDDMANELAIVESEG